MRIFKVALACLFPFALLAQPIGIFEKNADIGAVLHPGSAVFDQAGQSYKLTGAGSNIWAKKDEFQYAYKQMTGNFTLKASGKLLGTGVDQHRKFGWMVRTSLDTSAAMVCIAIHGDGLTSLQYRKTAGNMVEEVKSPIRNPDVFELERRGRSFFLSVAHAGESAWTVEIPDFEFPKELTAGLFICSHNKDVSESAQFNDVSITQASIPDVLSVASGKASKMLFPPVEKRIPVSGYNHVGLFVQDIQKSARFYREIVGLEPVEVPDNLKAIRSWFKIGPGQQLHLLAGRTEPVTNNDKNSAHVSWTIPNADPVEEYLKSKGIPYTRQLRFDGIGQIYITDPDGYVIELTEGKAIKRN
jgi:catechol 2,3-dioxygenase-like lactoylglutathione lyase family enzyme